MFPRSSSIGINHGIENYTPIGGWRYTHRNPISSVYYSSMNARARASASTRVMYASDPERKTEFPFLYPLPLSPLLLFLFLCPGERYAELQPASAPHHRAQVTESQGGGGVGPAVYPGTTRRPHIPSPFPFPTPLSPPSFFLYSCVCTRFQPLFLCALLFFLFPSLFLFPRPSGRDKER